MSSGGFHCLRTTWLVCNEFKAQVYLTPRLCIKMVLLVETIYAFFTFLLNWVILFKPLPRRFVQLVLISFNWKNSNDNSK